MRFGMLAMQRFVTCCLPLLVVALTTTPAFADTVPDVTGLTTAEATTLLKQSGFKVRVERRAGKPVDLVYAQEPLAFAKRATGTTIVIRTGMPGSATPTTKPTPSISNVPVFIGMRAADARERMKSWIGAVEESSVVVPELVGKVVQQWPDAGKSVPAGDRLIVVFGVARKPSDRHNTVPTLTGRSVAHARDIAKAKGFALTIEQHNGPVKYSTPNGPSILTQFPLAGSLAEAGSSIHVRVPLYGLREPTDPPPPPPPPIPGTESRPAAPQLTLPADRDSFRGARVGFDWRAAAAPDRSFQVRIERQPDGGSWTHERTIDTATQSLRNIDLPRGRFRWSARTRTGSIWGPWATPRSFYMYGTRR